MKEFELYVKDGRGEYSLVDAFETLKEALAEAHRYDRGSQVRMFSGRILATIGASAPIRSMVF